MTPESRRNADMEICRGDDRSVYRSIGVGVVLSLLLCSCKSTGAKLADRERPPGPSAVSGLSALWVEGVKQRSARPVERGIAVKVYLAGPASQQPVVGAGSFRFFAYPDSSAAESRIEPGRVWDFTPSETAQSLHKDPIGWAYSFWLPWGEPIGPEERLSLRASFVPAAGQPVISPASLVVLPDSERGASASRRSNAAAEPQLARAQ